MEGYAPYDTDDLRKEIVVHVWKHPPVLEICADPCRHGVSDPPHRRYVRAAPPAEAKECSKLQACREDFHNWQCPLAGPLCAECGVPDSHSTHHRPESTDPLRHKFRPAPPAGAEKVQCEEHWNYACSGCQDSAAAPAADQIADLQKRLGEAVALIDRLKELRLEPVVSWDENLWPDTDAFLARERQAQGKS